MAQDQLFERKPRAKAQGARAQAADRAGRHFDNPYTVLVESQFCVNGTLSQSDGSSGRGHATRDLPLMGSRMPRGGDVNGLFKERPFERVRLVENGQNPKLSLVQHS